MEKIVVDARGLSCPQPVLMTKQALTKAAPQYEILVDAHAAVRNISRFLITAGRKFEVREDGDENYTILIQGE